MTYVLPDEVFSVSVSGSREHATRPAARSLYNLLVELKARGARQLHHGCCTGWDATAHVIGQKLDYRMGMHPPTNTTHLAFGLRAGPNDRIYAPKPYKDRNEDIAFMGEVLLLGPLFPENDPRSKRAGTWQTGRRGRQWNDLVLWVDRHGEVHDVSR